MIKAPDTSAGIPESPDQTEQRQPTPHRDVADRQVEVLQQLVHELQAHQTELEIQNEKLRQARTDGYDFSPVGQMTLDTHGKIVAANLRAATLVGIDREKLIGQPFIRFVAQDSQDIFHWHCRKVLKTGTRQTCEMQLQKKSGASHWVHLESLAVDKEPGPVTHWQTALLDISEQKRTEGALRLAKFSMERAADAVYWIDQQAKILDVNEAASLMLGYSKEELCAMTVHDLNPDFQADRWPEFWAKTQQCGTMVLETVHRAKNGRLIPVEVSVNYLFYEGKEYHCAFVRDITERKRGAEEIAQLADRLELATRAAQIGVWDWNILRNELVWDDRMFALYGVKKEEFYAAYDTWLSRIHPDDRRRCDEAIQEALHKGKPYDIDFRIRWPDSTVRVIKASGQVMLDTDGIPLRMTGVNYDITDQKQAEEALGSSERLLNNILENIPSYVFATDRQHRFILLSNNLAQFYGKPKKDILGKTHHHVFPEELADVIQATNEQIMTSGITQQLEEVVSEHSRRSPTCHVHKQVSAAR